MKIAILTDDRVNVAERTGRAKEFAIVEIDNHEVKQIDYKTNSHEHHSHEQHNESDEHSHSDIVEIMSNADFLIVLNIGKHLKNDLDNNKIPYKKTELKTIQEIINSYK